MPVAEAAQFFAEASVHRSYPVIDEQGRLIGLVSRTDALRWRIEGALPDASLAEHISDASLPTAYPETPCALIADMMVETGIGRVPIVQPKTRRLVGLLARPALLNARNTQRRSETGRTRYSRQTPPSSSSAGLSAQSLLLPRSHGIFPPHPR